jgi:hypothetical protein
MKSNSQAWPPATESLSSVLTNSATEPLVDNPTVNPMDLARTRTLRAPIPINQLAHQELSMRAQCLPPPHPMYLKDHPQDACLKDKTPATLHPASDLNKLVRPIPLPNPLTQLPSMSLSNPCINNNKCSNNNQ